MGAPEALPFIPVPYMTVIPGRTPQQKVHKRLSDAKNAFDTPKHNPLKRKLVEQQYGYSTTHGWGHLYEFENGEWKLLFEVPQPTQEHEIEKYPYWESRPWKL